MAITLSSFLNFIIPIGVVLVFLAMLYYKLREPIDLILSKIYSLFKAGYDSVDVPSNPVTEVTYR